MTMMKNKILLNPRLVKPSWEQYVEGVHRWLIEYLDKWWRIGLQRKEASRNLFICNRRRVSHNYHSCKEVPNQILSISFITIKTLNPLA